MAIGYQFWVPGPEPEQLIRCYFSDAFTKVNLVLSCGPMA
jgi:hypothetical protein